MKLEKLTLALIPLLLLSVSCLRLPEYILSEEIPPVDATRKAEMLSAFFGLDNALTRRARLIWPQAPGKDGMPIVFSHEIDPNTLDASDFQIKTQKGEILGVERASYRPAVEEFELRTLLLLGDYGDYPDNEPIEVEIVGDLKSRDGQNLKGQKVTVTPLAEGPFLSYAEYFIPGKIKDEVLISCHGCHPSLCNDNLSGISIAVFLAKHLSQFTPYYSYRFIFIPGTIGSITWLAINEANVSQIKHGLVLSCLGDSGSFTYKKSRRGNTEIDNIITYVLTKCDQNNQIIDFFPYGYDERQYCSPGFNLPVGCLMRSTHNSFPEYHTSADNLDFVQPTYLAESFSKCISIVNILENNQVYYNKNPKCEPQLGKRGLYEAYSGSENKRLNQMAMLWVLNLSDGNYTLLDIAQKSGFPFEQIKQAADILLKYNLLAPYSNSEFKKL